ncbi:DUF4157 domain-containing protein [Azotobacter chroococcum subsp. isscasi]|uniref:eCIS core domain-containing protein n=1 Tax=Azotobacter chroococcum TaxID=353 RepID=UPI00103F15E9|nr:DUF4157 domain-containing protein [Azotobacter chroococcum]TBW12974.1 DUF4157 domain-containing protein [Azotobacter chroococcum subsp. isscasi]
MSTAAPLRTQAAKSQPASNASHAGLLLQRKCACGSPTASLTGECAECASKKRLQTKLTIGASNDPLELEADRVADQVMARPAHAGLSGASPCIRRFSGQQDGLVVEAPPSVDRVLASPGRPLELALRQDMEQRFGYDFSKVQVHFGPAAEQSARDVSAQAYTVGRNIVFGAGRFVPGSQEGRRLIAHELTHVVQQEGGISGIRSPSMLGEDHRTDLRAEGTADTAAREPGRQITAKSSYPLLHRHKDDLVGYTGGQSGVLHVIQAGRSIYRTNAVSGHPGHGENEPGAGPIPTGRYTLHPKVIRSAVASMQSGVCGANAIASGYQEITSTDASPCSGAHYCNVSCPTVAEPGRMCFTPKDCWGPYRIKIEGSQAVVTPSGKRAVRDGFYIHGGSPKDAVTSGCVKSLNDDVFVQIQSLFGIKGAVPFCVGSSCPDLTRFPTSDSGDEEGTQEAASAAGIESVSPLEGFLSASLIVQRIPNNAQTGFSPHQGTISASNPSVLMNSANNIRLQFLRRAKNRVRQLEIACEKEADPELLMRALPEEVEAFILWLRASPGQPEFCDIVREAKTLIGMNLATDIPPLTFDDGSTPICQLTTHRVFALHRPNDILICQTALAPSVSPTFRALMLIHEIFHEPLLGMRHGEDFHDTSECGLAGTPEAVRNPYCLTNVIVHLGGGIDATM